MKTTNIYALSPSELMRILVSAGWRQHQIAKVVGLSQSVVCRTLDGKIKGTDYRIVDMLRRLVLEIQSFDRQP
jgi:predicted transcriptional regulator